MSNISSPIGFGIPLAPGSAIHALAGTAAVINAAFFGIETDPAGNISEKNLALAVLGASDAIVYTAPAGTTAVITQIMLVNTSGSVVSGIKIGLNGTAATAANQLLAGISIPANGVVVIVNGDIKCYDSGLNAQVAGAANTAFDSTIPAITTPLALGTTGSASVPPHRDHTHQSPGGIAAIVAATAAISNTETQVVGATIPASLLRVGTVLRLRAYGTITSTVDNNVTFNIRLGPTTLTGNIPAAITSKCGNSGTVTAAPFLLEVEVTIRTIGASGTCYGVGKVTSVAGTTGQALVAVTVMFTPASVAVDTTVANIFELTIVTAAATTAVTVQTATEDVAKM